MIDVTATPGACPNLGNGPDLPSNASCVSRANEEMVRNAYTARAGWAYAVRPQLTVLPFGFGGFDGVSCDGFHVVEVTRDEKGQERYESYAGPFATRAEAQDVLDERFGVPA